MKKINKNQTGFSTVEIIIVIIVISLIGGLGWYAWHVRHDKSSYSTTATANSYPTAAAKTTAPDISTSASSFDTSKITGYDKIPTGAQALVLAAAKDTFDKCTGDPKIKPYARVAIAQSNFVAIELSCGGGGIHRYGLDNNKWAFLGSGATGLDCETVTKYKITQTSLVNYNPPTCTNFATGEKSTIPE